MSRLNNSTLSKLPSDIKVPDFNRDEVKVGIFHFGVGGFHRAHQALLIDNLLSKRASNDWGICGVNILKGIDNKITEVMKSQDCLYTLVEKHPNGKFSYRVVGSILDHIGPDKISTLITRLASPEAKIVTLTITEGGYNTNPSTGEFDLANVDVQHDLKDPQNPKTTFGIVVEALRRRKEKNMGGFTVLSCDNLQGNGHIAEKSFTAFAKALNEDLYEWIVNNVTFPNSMVDRITPVTTDDDRKAVSEKLKVVVDEWPVVCEDFLQWVIEDKFVAGRPDFIKLPGVTMVNDVEPYEFMKLRLLNAGHQAIAYFGLLLQYEFVHDITQHQLIAKFLKDYMDKEATSTLKHLEGFDVSAYKAKTVERFQNSYVKDTLARLAVDGSDRVFKFVIPVIVDRLKKNESIYLSTAIVASFAYYLNGVNEKGNKIEVVDRAKEKLKILSANLLCDPTLIRDEHEMFGEVVRDERFIKVFKEIYDKIKIDGSEATLEWLTK